MNTTAHEKKTKNRLFKLNPHTAETVFHVANFLLVAALVVGVVATYLVYIATSIKEEDSTKKLADATASAARANLEAAKANERAERIKQQLAWREVAPSQQAAIKAALANAPFKVTITWVTGDAEGSEFARSIRDALVNAGIGIDAFSPMTFFGTEPHGITVTGSERDEVRRLTDSLRNARLGTINLKYENDGKKYVTNIKIGYRARPVLPAE